LRITIDGQRAELSTGIYIFPQQWNGAAERLYVTDAATRLHNQTLDLREAAAIQAPVLLVAQGKDITSAAVAASLRRKRNSTTPDLLAALEQQLTTYYERHNPHTYRAFSYFVGYLRQWHGKEPLYVAAFTREKARTFARWLCEQISPASARTALGALAAMMVRSNLLEVSPFLKIRLPKAEPTERIPLTKQQLKALELASFPRDKMTYARDIYLAQFYLQGSRIGVVLELCWSQYDGECIRYKAEKSGPHKVVRVTPGLRAILARQYRRQDSPLIFPALRPDYHELDKQGQFAARRAATTRVWEGLNQVGKQLGFHKLHSHMARHTMALLTATSNNGSIRAAQHVLGHSNPRQTEKYIRSMQTDEINDAADNVYDNM